MPLPPHFRDKIITEFLPSIFGWEALFGHSVLVAIALAPLVFARIILFLRAGVLCGVGQATHVSLYQTFPLFNVLFF